jgi:hypothetical protein
MTAADGRTIIEKRLALWSSSEYSLHKKVALTYDSERYTDGAGPQLHRIYGIYSVARLLGVPYLHTPLSRVDYQGMIALQDNANAPQFHHPFNDLFHIESDQPPPGELQEVRTIHLSLDAVGEYAKAFDHNETGGRPYLIRLAMPYHIADVYPDCYEVCKRISPFPAQPCSGRPLRVAIHVRRGELLVLDSDRMLPNAYYVNTARNVARELEALQIDYRIEVHTEMPTKQFVVEPGHHGIGDRIGKASPIDPAMCSLDEFNVLPNLVLCVNDTAIECLRKLATADILIMSRSSFSYVAAILNRNGIALQHPFWHPALPGWITVEPDGAFDAADLAAAVKAYASGTTMQTH